MGEQKKRRLSSWGVKNVNNNNNNDDSDDAVELLEPNDDEMEKRGRVTMDPSISSPLRTKNPNKTADLNTSPKQVASKKRKSVGWGVHDKENQQLTSQLASSTPTSTAHLSNEQLADLYSNCIKLCTENVCNINFFFSKYCKSNAYITIHNTIYRKLIKRTHGNLI